MSNDEIERRLQGLRPTGVRPEVREEVLGAVREELSLPVESRFDRFLRMRSTWAIAAALLVAVLGANLVLQADASSRRARRRARFETDARSLVEYRVWIARWTTGDLR